MNDLFKAEEIIHALVRKMNLQNWTISTSYEEICEDTPGCAAEINVQRDYWKAHITFFKIAFNEDENLGHIIKHELCHIITEPLTEYCYDLLNGKLRTSRDIEQQREIMTEWIAKLI